MFSHANVVLTTVGDISLGQGAQGKRKEVDGENTANAAGVRKRGDAVSYSLLAEVASNSFSPTEICFEPNSGEHIP